MPAIAAATFFLICGVVVAFGGVQSARRTAHATSVWIIRAIGVPQFFADKIVEAGAALTKLVTHELGEYAVPKIEQFVRFVAGLTQYVAVVGYWSLLWPIELYRAVSWLIHTYIPRAIHGETRPIDRRARSAEAIARDAERRAINTHKGVPATAKTVVIETVPANVRGAARDIEWLRAHVKALELAIGATGAIAIPQAPALPWGVTAKQIRRRLRRLEGRTVGLGAVALVAVALGRMGLGGLRCRNVKRAIRGICGANPAWLSLLFGAGAEAWIITHLCEFIAEVGAAAKAIQPELLQFVEIEDALIGCHGATKPKNLPLTWPAVPAVGEALTLSV